MVDCLETIFNQKSKCNYFIALAENASTDGTREICLDYAQNIYRKLGYIYINAKII